KELHTLKAASPVDRVAFSPDGTRLATADIDMTVKVWDPRSGQAFHTLKGHTSSLFDVAFSPDGQRLVSRDISGETIVWDVAKGQRVQEPVPEVLVPSGARSPDGRLFAWIDRETIRLIGPPDAEELLVRRGATRLDADWHREEAALWERQRQWPAAAFHLEHA